MERMENNRIAMRVYAGVCAGSCLVGKPQKRRIYTVKECSRKRGWMSSKQCEWCRIGVNGGGL